MILTRGPVPLGDGRGSLNLAASYSKSPKCRVTTKL